MEAEVLDGLSEGERVIVHGINKVYHGTLTDPISEQDYAAELAAAEEAATTEPTAGETVE